MEGRGGQRKTSKQKNKQTNKTQFRRNKVGSSSLWWGIRIFLKLHSYDFCFSFYKTFDTQRVQKSYMLHSFHNAGLFTPFCMHENSYSPFPLFFYNSPFPPGPGCSILGYKNPGLVRILNLAIKAEKACLQFGCSKMNWENAFEQKKKKLELKFNTGLGLIAVGLRPTGPYLTPPRPPPPAWALSEIK